EAFELAELPNPQFQTPNSKFQITDSVSPPFDPKPQSPNPRPQALLFEAPTGYGKTGCVLEFALGQLQSGRFSRLIWLTGKSTGQLQVVRTLEQMTDNESDGRRPDPP